MGTVQSILTAFSMTGTGPTDQVDRAELKDRVEELFKHDADKVALFYLVEDMGFLEASGGYLLACDSRRGDEGISLADVLSFANASSSKEQGSPTESIDSCHSWH